MPQRFRRRATSLVAVFLLAFAVMTAPSAQQPSAPPTQPPRFRGGTNLVRVDVFATKDGRPLPDLTAADFEVLEDGTPQRIDSFEHVSASPAGPQATRVEPNSVGEGRQMIEDPHRRVFVIYLDTGNVDVGGSHDIRDPLIKLLEHVLGPDDIVGVMTPDMNPAQITFARKTQVIEDALSTDWIWGRKDTIHLDERETLYNACYPPGASDAMMSPIARALTARRRERMVLDSFEELVRYLGSAREGRTAVITVTPGWVLYQPDEALASAKSRGAVPGNPGIGGLGPNAGLTTATKQNSAEGSMYECDRDRMELAMMDDEQRFREILGEANRADVSFYPVDPRGLVVFDSALGPDPMLPLTEDRQNLLDRASALRTLAENTDGIAILQTKDLDRGLRRVADDLTSYYLIGYYSTNTRLDGKFRQISVRSRRPGVDIRARRGYRAATQDEVDAARRAVDAPAPAATAAISRALGALDGDTRGLHLRSPRDQPLVFHRGPTTGNRLEPASQRTFPRSDRLRFEQEAPAGAMWTGALLDRNGHTLSVPVTVGQRSDPTTGKYWLRADLALAPLGPGDYVVSLTTSDSRPDARRLVAIRVTQQ